MSDTMKMLAVSGVLLAGLMSPALSAEPGQPSPLAMSGTSNDQMSGMSGMQNHGMSGNDMQAMMTRCTQMKQGMAEGKPMSADMQKTMTQCDQMDHAMQNAPAPSATQDR